MIRSTIIATLVALNLSSVAVQASYGTDLPAPMKVLPLGHIDFQSWYSHKDPVLFWEVWDAPWPIVTTLGLMAFYEAKHPTAEELRRQAITKLVLQLSTLDRLQPKAPRPPPVVSNEQIAWGLGFMAVGSAIVLIAGECEILLSNRRRNKRTDG